MNTERLFPVAVAPNLLDAFEPQVRAKIDLAPVVHGPGGLPPGRPKPVDELETLLSSWGTLGFYAAEPSEVVPPTADARRRAEAFSCSFKLSVLQRKSDDHLEWLVDYDGVGEAWLDILLNCLEGFHVQVAPIARVTLTSEI